VTMCVLDPRACTFVMDAEVEMWRALGERVGAYA
jgi:hypothetical protein